MSLTPAEAFALAGLLVVGLWLATRRKRAKRNRWLGEPRKDDRSSIEQCKPHMPQGTRY